MIQPKQQIRLLTLGFGLIVSLMIVIVILALSRIDASRRILDDAVREHYGCIDLSSQMYRASRERLALLQQIAIEPDPFTQDAKIQKFRDLAATFVQARHALIKRDLSNEESGLLEQQNQGTNLIVPLQDQTIDLILEGKRNQAQDILLNQVMPTHSKVLELLADFRNIQTGEMRKAIDETRNYDEKTYKLLFVMGGGMVGLAMIIAVFVLRRITKLTDNLTGIAQQLKTSLREAEFQRLALDEHAIVSISDPNDKITYVNALMSKVSQYAPDELLGSSHRMLNSAYHPEEFFAALWQTVLAGKVWHGQIRNCRKDGSYYWVDTTVVPFLGEQGKPYQYVAMQTDITAIKEAEAILSRGRDEMELLVAERTADLQERQALLQKITSSAQDAIVMIDDTDCITFWNEAAEAMFGYDAGEIMGRKLHDLVMPARYRSEYEPRFAEFSHTGQGGFVGKRREVSAIRRDGAEFPLELSLSAVKIKDRWTAIGIARDITERKQAEETLRQLATTDPLTGIANRRQLDATLDFELKRAERYRSPLALVLFDIDHFKAVNDRHGHQAGDRVLTDLATLVSGNVRASDLFARWGGEEFAILAPNCELAIAQQLAEKLRTLIEGFSFPVVGKVTCSFGITAFHPGESIKDLVGRTDQALYLAKSSGRNRVESL